MPPPPRSLGRHRIYEDLHRRRLAFIRRSRALGFSLNDTRDLLGLARGHDLTCVEVKALTEQHIADIRGKIRDLGKLDRVLIREHAEDYDPEFEAVFHKLVAELDPPTVT